ncbi:MAG: hypothetical protein FWC91_05580 [Defluviitaleaceae bacterium]|nr:hypothetical protein [Defluviitaleaceae bacterium]
MLQDVIFAALLAFFLTWFIKTMLRVLRVVITRSTELGYRPTDLDTVMQRCYTLFPLENLSFKGATFNRGVDVQVVTTRKKIIEGKFIGYNKDNMVCFVTPSSVVAHELGNIEEMRILR